MKANEKFMFVNIREYLAQADNEEVGEPELLCMISDFSCPKNPDVEKFLKKNCIDFTKKNQSVTYLVYDIEDGTLVAYFTIALKPLTVQAEKVSNTVKRKLQRVSKFDEQTKSYTMSAFLIAQLGKNYMNDAYKRITGAELLELALNVVEDMQYMGGGMVVFLEANNEEKLLSFYKSNRFRQFGTRQTTSTDDEPHELVQFLRLL